MRGDVVQKKLRIIRIERSIHLFIPPSRVGQTKNSISTLIRVKIRCSISSTIRCEEVISLIERRIPLNIGVGKRAKKNKKYIKTFRISGKEISNLLCKIYQNNNQKECIVKRRMKYILVNVCLILMKGISTGDAPRKVRTIKVTTNQEKIRVWMWE